MKQVLCVSALWLASHAAAQATAPSPPPQDWTLSAVIQRAGTDSREVQSAQRATEAARADAAGAAVTPPAQFSVLSQAINPHDLGHGPWWDRPVDTIFRIDKVWERGGKADLRERQAEAGVAAAQQDLRNKARAQRIAAAQAYWDLKLAQEASAVGERNWQLAQDSSQAARLRQAQGDLSRLEATRLGVEADRAANERAQARQQLAQAQWDLARTLALDPGTATALRAADAWPEVPDPGQSPPDADEAWLAARPDAQAAQQRLQQAQANLALAQAQRSADVTFSVQFEHEPAVANRLWGVGVAFPLGVDGRQAGPLTRALVAVAEAQAQLDQVRQAALAERAQQTLGLSIAHERLMRLRDQLLPQAREALKGAEFARQQGALPLQDVLDARRALHGAELDEAAAQADQAKAWAALSLSQ